MDEIVITTLVDNMYDALLTDDERTTRAPLASARPEPRNSKLVQRRWD